MLDADFARKLSKNNKERQEFIKDFIERGEKKIKQNASEGRRLAYVTYGKGCRQYQEVLEHFRKLGFDVYTDETNVCTVKW